MCQEDGDAVSNVLLLVSNKEIYAGNAEQAEQELEEFYISLNVDKKHI